MKTILLCIALCIASSVTHSTSAQTSATTNDFLNYIQKYGEDPYSYVIGKMKTHYVVSLGEDHWIKDHQLFLCDLMNAIEQDTTIHLDILALEFGNISDQALADEFMKSPVYREDLVIKILQHSADTYGWPYLEGVEIFRTLWENNKDKPQDERTQIVLLDPAYVIPYMNNEEYVYTCSRDMQQTSIIQQCIISKKRTLFYAGLGHTRSCINGMYMPDENIYYNYHSAGFLLKTLYPGQVFSIKLWGGLMGSNGYTPIEGEQKWERVFDGKIDAAFKANGNKPVAFDINKSPMAEITVPEFYCTPEETLRKSDDKSICSPYTRTEMLNGDVDGILFFKPVEEFSGATVYGKFFDEQFVKLIEKRTEGEVKTRKQVFEYIKKGHPIMSESLDLLIAGEEN